EERVAAGGERRAHLLGNRRRCLGRPQGQGELEEGRHRGRKGGGRQRRGGDDGERGGRNAGGGGAEGGHRGDVRSGGHHTQDRLAAADRGARGGGRNRERPQDEQAAKATGSGHMDGFVRVALAPRGVVSNAPDAESCTAAPERPSTPQCSRDAPRRLFVSCAPHGVPLALTLRSPLGHPPAGPTCWTGRQKRSSRSSAPRDPRRPTHCSARCSRRSGGSGSRSPASAIPSCTTTSRTRSRAPS